MVAEREIPARQCTMTLQFDTLALSVGRKTGSHECTCLSTNADNNIHPWHVSFLQETIGLFTRKVKGVRHPETGPFQTYTVCESVLTVTMFGYVVLNITA